MARTTQEWLNVMKAVNTLYGTNFKNLEDVKAFQRKHGLVADGKIGRNTMNAILNEWNDEGFVVPANHVGENAFEEYRSFGDLPLTVQQDLLNNKYQLVGNNSGNILGPDFNIESGLYLFDTNTNNLVTKDSIRPVDPRQALTNRLIRGEKQRLFVLDNAYMYWLVSKGVEQGIIPELVMDGNTPITYDQLLKVASSNQIPTELLNTRGYLNFWHMVDLNNTNALEAAAANTLWTALLTMSGVGMPLTATNLISMGASMITPLATDYIWQSTHDGKSQGQSLYETLSENGIMGENIDPAGYYWLDNLLHTSEALAAGTLTNFGINYGPEVYNNITEGFGNIARGVRAFGDPYEMGAWGELSGQPRQAGVSGQTNTGRFVNAGEILQPGEEIISSALYSSPDAYAGGEARGFGYQAQGSTNSTAGKGAAMQGRTGYVPSSNSLQQANQGVVRHSETDFVGYGKGPKVLSTFIEPELSPINEKDLISYGYGNLQKPIFILNLPPEIERETYLKEISDKEHPFITWWKTMMRKYPGTIQHYPGDNLGTDYSGPRDILMVYGGTKGDPILQTTRYGSNTEPTVGRVFGGLNEYNVKDLVEYETPKVTVEEGKREGELTNEYIYGFPMKKFGGKLVKKLKYLY